MSNVRGLFLTVDGPSAVGKSTVCAALQTTLAQWSRRCVDLTSTPSTTDMGNLARQGTHQYSGYALSCLVAADRYDHRSRTVEPVLAKGGVVVCDRYMPSAFALDRLDAVPVEYIGSLYAALPPPDVAFILLGDPAVCAARSAARGGYSRFHSPDVARHERELSLFEDAATLLVGIGYPVKVVQVGSRPSPDVARELSEIVKGMAEGKVERS